ncbi:TetR/AcrR family transcriptional regulator [Brevibacterium casei]|uniref:Tetracycline repressor protein class B from transposon Tn10 n=1 Tax=Brevibacterium casei TaxID=33889 RepID=A0A449D7K8_9MICO|nr:TetR/AcrR family transcriptional regulator C-terminal domain-containing protein [Brevibacterium casei]MDH5149053.1 TetR/AcrR family transcriptional regulator C-terminal domain-containing protein [Brevibacterium casei]VEW13584.1 Tetracycline repressor protein class B from transposon Tn10 [Brevibacterium casei]
MSTSRSGGRRPKGDSLSRAAIVAAAVDLLDEAGESGLTVRALAARLNTGPGSIYWHVGDRSGLLELACDSVLAEAVPGTSADGPLGGVDAEGSSAIRAVGLGLYDALDAHTWAGSLLPRMASVPSLLRALDRIGTALTDMGVPEERQFHSATAVLNYVIGVAGQMSRNAEAAGEGSNQAEWLDARASEWERTDPEEYPFLHRIAGDFRDHDDREQFVAGLDLIIAGIVATTSEADG